MQGHSTQCGRSHAHLFCCCCTCCQSSGRPEAAAAMLLMNYILQCSALTDSPAAINTRLIASRLMRRA